MKLKLLIIKQNQVKIIKAQAKVNKNIKKDTKLIVLKN